MAHRVIRAPGRIVVNPDGNLAEDAYPFGGTEVGRSKLCVVIPEGQAFRVESEGLGEATDVLRADNRHTFACFLRGWTDSAISILFPQAHRVGEVTGHAVYDVPGRGSPGESMLQDSIRLLYVPDDPVNVPAVMIYGGIPDWSPGAELAFQRGDELGIPLVVDCLRDSACNILRIGRLADLTIHV